MKKNMNALMVVMFGMVSGVLAGCGGAEPLQLLDVSRKVTLGYPVNESTDLTFFTTAATSGNTYLLTYTGSTATGINVLALAPGFVSAADANSVTIYHTPHLSTRISNLANVLVQVGQNVAERTLIGFYSPSLNLGALAVTVYEDGAEVCPSTYFAPVVKSALLPRFTAGTAAFFCQ